MFYFYFFCYLGSSVFVACFQITFYGVFVLSAFEVFWL